jgi:hypothetical protein
VNKPYENIYPLLLPTTFVETQLSMFPSSNHSIRMKGIKIKKQAYHPIYDFIEHRFDG